MQAFVRQMCVLYILYTHIQTYVIQRHIHIYIYVIDGHWKHINFFFLTSFSSDFIKLNKYSISLNVIKSGIIILKAAQKVNDNNYIVLCNSMDVLYNHQSVVTDFHFTMIKNYFNVYAQSLFTFYLDLLRYNLLLLYAHCPLPKLFSFASNAPLLENLPIR